MRMHRRSSIRSRAFDQNVCLGFLEHRMAAWAAFIAIDGTYGAAMGNENEGTSQYKLSDEIDRVMNAIDAFDDALMGVESRWVPMVRSTNLLRNWHALLAAPFQASPPWWMTAALTPDRRFAFSSPCIG